MAKTGRPPLFDEGKQRELLAIVSVTGNLSLALNYVGCARRTVYAAAKRSPEFGAKFKQAKEQLQLVMMQRVHKASELPERWRAAAWALERLYPDRYAPQAPGKYTEEQMRQMLVSMAEAVTATVQGAALRKRLIARLALVFPTPMQWPSERGGQPKLLAHHDQGA